MSHLQSLPQGLTHGSYLLLLASRRKEHCYKILDSLSSSCKTCKKKAAQKGVHALMPQHLFLDHPALILDLAFKTGRLPHKNSQPKHHIQRDSAHSTPHTPSTQSCTARQLLR